MDDALIAELVSEAGATAMAFVGMPEQQMLAALYDIREAMKVRLAPILPVDVATLAAEAFVFAIAKCRAALEADLQRGTLQ
jgi:hypothetical protein